MKRLAIARSQKSKSKNWLTLNAFKTQINESPKLFEKVKNINTPTQITKQIYAFFLKHPKSPATIDARFHCRKYKTKTKK